MKTKDFDCVEMKDQIQSRILEEFDQLTPEEQHRRTEERILNDPILGPIWRQGIASNKDGAVSPPGGR